MHRPDGSDATEPATEREIAASHVISTMPLRELVHTLSPPPPPEVLAAADGLHYRDYLTVALVVPGLAQLSRQLDLHPRPRGQVGRIQNYGSWSPYLVKDGHTCLGLEYFVFEGDEMWEMADDDLIALATKELGELGLVEPGDVEAGYVVRVPKAYPYYDFSLQGQRRDHPALPRGRGAQRAPGRPQRHAQVQQPGPLHVHRHAHGGEHLRGVARHLVGQRRGGVPRRREPGRWDGAGCPDTAAARDRPPPLRRARP